MDTVQDDVESVDVFENRSDGNEGVGDEDDGSSDEEVIVSPERKMANSYVTSGKKRGPNLKLQGEVKSVEVIENRSDGDEGEGLSDEKVIISPEQKMVNAYVTSGKKTGPKLKLQDDVESVNVFENRSDGDEDDGSSNEDVITSPEQKMDYAYVNGGKKSGSYLKLQDDVESVDVFENRSDGDEGESSSDEEVIISPEQKMANAYVTGGKKTGPKLKLQDDVESVDVFENQSDGDEGESSSDEEVIISPEQKIANAYVTGGKKTGPKLKLQDDVKSAEEIENPSDADEGESSSDEEVIISRKKKIDFAYFNGGKKQVLKCEPIMIFTCDLCTYRCKNALSLRTHFIHFHTKPLMKKQIDQVKRKMKVEREKEKLKKYKEAMAKGVKLQYSVATRGRKTGCKSNAKFLCTHCTYLTTRKLDLKKHIASVHNEEKPFHCIVCNHSTALAETLKQHILRVHYNIKYKCTECNYLSRIKAEYTRHLMSNHKYNPYGCTACKFSCSSYNDLKKHIMVEHKGRKLFRCSNCDYQSCHHSGLVKHMNYFHTKEKLKCPLCKFTTDDVMALMKHKKLTHPSKTNLIKMERRKKKKMESENDNVRNQDNNSHDVDVMEPGKEQFHCDSCTFTTMSERELNCHLTDIHNREKLFICSCSFTTIEKFQFEEHLWLEHDRPHDQLEKLALNAMKVIGCYSLNVRRPKNPINQEKKPRRSHRIGLKESSQVK